VDGLGDQLPPLDLIQAGCLVETTQHFAFSFAMRNPGREMQPLSPRRWDSCNRA
jgi:hypothetical protein